MSWRLILPRLHHPTNYCTFDVQNVTVLRRHRFEEAVEGWRGSEALYTPSTHVDARLLDKWRQQPSLFIARCEPPQSRQVFE